MNYPVIRGWTDHWGYAHILIANTPEELHEKALKFLKEDVFQDLEYMVENCPEDTADHKMFITWGDLGELANEAVDNDDGEAAWNVIDGIAIDEGISSLEVYLI